jgi:hypothetical protein
VPRTSIARPQGLSVIADTIECAMRLGVIKVDGAMSLLVGDDADEDARNRRIAEIMNKLLDARSAMTKVMALLEAGKESS